MASAGRDAALVYAADKLSKVRELRIRLTVVGDYACRPEGQQKVEHHWRSLAMLEDVLAGHPLVAQLRFELEAMRDFPPRDAGCEALEQAVPAGLPQVGSPVASGAGRHSR